MKSNYLAASIAIALSSGPTLVLAKSSASAIDGRWDAALINNGPAVPFRLDISGNGPTLKGTFYDGFRPYDATTSASFENGQLILKAEHYLTTISATLKSGELVGTTELQGPSYELKYDFHAVRHVEPPPVAAAAPSIAGSWEIPLETPSSKGEKAFRFIVDQHGGEVAASILRVDGDTGAYSGRYQDGKWILSHFDGHRPGVIEVTPHKGGNLTIIAHNEAFKRALEGRGSEKEAAPGNNAYAETRYEGVTQYTAYRSTVARAKGLPEPDDYQKHTAARDPNERFTFNFPDVDGKLVSNNDPRFKDKVVLAIVTGTWCPNCHDEAKYLVQLYKQYHAKGLEIVALDFEEADQQESLTRVRAFIKQYQVPYTYLIAGTPDEMWDKVPQAVNLNTWPATLFIGRDGKVKGTYSGFATAASGVYGKELKDDFTSMIDRLLAGQSVQSSASIAVPSADVASR
jgi:thiol-disulfide isomerase/thioredoxin